MGSKDGERVLYEWRSEIQFKVNVTTAVLYHLLRHSEIHLCGGILFLKSVTLYQRKTQSPSLTSLFVIVDFETWCLFFFFFPFLNFANFCQKMKSPFHLLSLPNPDDACCQGDRHNPGDRPFLWAAPRDWPIDQGGGLQIEHFDWLAGWQKQGPRQTEIV